MKHVCLFSLGLAVVLAAGCGDAPLAVDQVQDASATLAKSSGKRSFNAHLDGRQEVPPVDTKATGNAHFKLSSDGMSIDYTLKVNKIDRVTMAHIHMAKTGANGPVVVDLYTGPVTGKVHGTLASGTIRASNLKGPLAGQPLSRLIELMNAGETYANVHTSAHPSGEMRGQIGGGGDDDDDDPEAEFIPPEAG